MRHCEHSSPLRGPKSGKNVNSHYEPGEALIVLFYSDNAIRG